MSDLLCGLTASKWIILSLSHNTHIYTHSNICSFYYPGFLLHLTSGVRVHVCACVCVCVRVCVCVCVCVGSLESVRCLGRLPGSIGLTSSTRGTERPTHATATIAIGSGRSSDTTTNGTTGCRKLLKRATNARTYIYTQCVCVCVVASELVGVLHNLFQII